MLPDRLRPVYAFMDELRSLRMNSTLKRNLVNFIKGHLLFASVASTYIVLAIKLLEEPGLRRKIGPQYEKYMETTPAFCPFLTMGKSTSVEKKE